MYRGRTRSHVFIVVRPDEGHHSITALGSFMLSDALFVRESREWFELPGIVESPGG